VYISSVLKDLTLTYPLYFVYGLTFLFLGASIALKDLKASQLKLSGNLWLLSLFGFSHGIHEWIELFLLINAKHLSTKEVFWVRASTLIIVLLSFLFLLQFGLALLYSISRKRFFFWSKFGALGIFVLLLVYLSRHEFPHDVSIFRETDILYRRTFCLFGSFITGYSLIVYSRAVKKLSRRISRYFFFTGLGFFLYGIFGGIIPSRTLLPLFSIPVEFFRGLAAVLITYFLMKALNIFDIETRNELEQKIRRLAQSEKMASLGQLAAGIAHGINTPLTSASLDLQMLRGQFDRQLQNGGATAKLDAIERNMDRASTIAKELLQFSHVKETQLEFNDINQVIDDSLELLQYKLKNVELQLQQNNIPKVPCDAGKLGQVFVNIINNAIDAMPDGGDLSISSQFLGDEVWITFSDTGPGIPEAFLQKAFDPFFTTKQIGKGTGLGLSICYAIIEQHHGKIELETEKNKGASVTIRLPAIPSKTSEQTNSIDT